MKGQSLKATPDPVRGVLGESVDITWTLTKEDKTDKVLTTRLFLGNFTESKLLYEGVKTLTKQDLAKDIFRERIQASFEEPVYTLTLRNLSFNDTYTFTLVIFQQIQGTINLRPTVVKSVSISEVKGTCFL